MGQVQVVDNLLALPAKCYYCGTSEPDRGPWLDTGIEIEYYGVVYYCTLCMNDLANKMGYITPEVADELKLQVLELTSSNLSLQERCSALEYAIHALTKVGYNGSGDNLQFEYAPAVPVSDVILPEPELPFGEEGLESGEERLTEPDSEQGLADLRSSESESNPFEL